MNRPMRTMHAQAPGAALDCDLPAELAAREPPEARGLRRDEVRLMVSHLGDDRVEHGRFDELPRFLRPGDLLVVNRSATIEASLPARRVSDGAGSSLSPPVTIRR